jgi:hypothetical protein
MLMLVDLGESPRDYEEHLHWRHQEHTADGDLYYCDDVRCPKYVHPTDRDPDRDKCDRAMREDNIILPAVA